MRLKVAVLSLTRDRLSYTKHCFAKLHEHAGCDFDHYVLDQGSTDGTQEWLFEHAGDFKHIEMLGANIGISKAMNWLLDCAPGYDVYVKFDNDCELTKPDTLKIIAMLVKQEHDFILSPKIMGLKSPPPHEKDDAVSGFTAGYVGQIGGIFMAIPGWVFDEFRYDDNNPTWGMDDVQLSQWFRNRGGKLAYLLDYPANHYLTTVGQEAEMPEYWNRKKQEMGIA